MPHGFGAAAPIFRVASQGARVRQPPTNFNWALEMQVEDLDGNIMRLGSEPKPDQPFGPWLDMDVNRWIPLSEGGWRRL
jgi:hypothetical protein